MKFCFPIILFFALITGNINRSFGQLYFPEDMVKITGQVVDASTNAGLSSVQVLNFRVHGGTMSDNSGNFSIQADPSDTLTFKLLGYQERKIPVKNLLSEKELPKIALTVIRYAIPEVQVEGKAIHMNFGIGGKQNPLPSELRSEDFNSKPGVLSAIFNPLGYLHYNLSKSEKEKRNMLAVLHSEREWKLISLVYNKDVVQKLTSLKGEELDDFMAYCNAYSDFNANVTVYEVHKKIKDLLIEYKRNHPSK